jgi:hypothetical protein
MPNFTDYEKMHEDGLTASDLYRVIWTKHDSRKARLIVKRIFNLSEKEVEALVKEADDEMFTSYVSARNNGASPLDIHKLALARGLDKIDSIRLVRMLFELDFEEAMRALSEL